ncbi:unnamed protein product [Taenia asiatica]|uniref:Uncharacterized protein n=1 Tax=Taenia asiatica TaxID=60517 RepID=A0A0R3WGB4_TAEAS|nr:unnamed protein product [Taenia asiatica]
MPGPNQQVLRMRMGTSLLNALTALPHHCLRFIGAQAASIILCCHLSPTTLQVQLPIHQLAFMSEQPTSLMLTAGEQSKREGKESDGEVEEEGDDDDDDDDDEDEDEDVDEDEDKGEESLEDVE